MPVDKSRIRKILVIQLRAIGDVVLTTAVLPVLREHFPAARLHFLTDALSAPLLQGLPHLDKIVVYPYSVKNVLGVARFIPEIRREKYDLVIDYQGTPGTAYLTRFSGAEYRLGWEMRRRQWAYNLHSAANRNREYVAVQKCRALEALGIRQVNTGLELAVGEEELATVDAYLENLQIGPERLRVNMTPLGKRQARQWFPERMAGLADLLAERHGAALFFNRAPGEAAAAESIAAAARHTVHVLPAWPLRTFAAFLSRMDLHFSYDNGPKHLATAVGTPTLSLFATDPPQLWNPAGDDNHPFILSGVPCRFCGLRACPLMICMKQIEPVQVLKKIEEIPAIRHKLRLTDK